MGRRTPYAPGFLPSAGGGGGPVDCATNCADELAAQYAAGEAAGLIAGAASVQARWRSAAFAAPSVQRDPLGLLSGSISRSGGVVSVTLNAGITAAGPHEGLQLYWPIRDALGRALSSLTGITGYLRAVCPVLPPVGSGVRIYVFAANSDNLATATGAYGIGLIPHPTSNYLMTIANGTGGGAFGIVAAGSAAASPAGAVGGWAFLPGGTSNIYRNLISAPMAAVTGTPINYATTTGASGSAPKTAATFAPTHLCLAIMATAPLGSPVSVQVSPQAGLLDLDHTDFTGAA